MSTFIGTDLVDNIVGTSSADIIYGLAGNDILKGNKGNDTIYGGADNDTIYGGDSNDFLDGNAGSDKLYGDAGNDVFHYSYNENLGFTDVYDGGTGRDTLVISFTEAEFTTLKTSIDQAVAAFNSPKAPTVFYFNNYIAGMNLSVTKVESLVVNVAPKAVLDTSITDESTPITINVLANDSDLNGNILTLTNVTGMPLGTLASIIDNKIYFDPGTTFNYLANGESTNVELTYSVTDGYVTSSAKINITINGLNPIAVADYFKDLNAGGQQGANVLANDHGGIAAYLVSGPERAESFTLNTDGTFTYTPQAGFNGTDSFTYKSYDGFDYSEATTVLLDMQHHVSLRADIATADAFNLSSNPYATKTIFLDFDGHLTSGTKWNEAFGIDVINTPAFDMDGDVSNFSQAELDAIIDIWYQVQEDFAPFNVNITTLDLSGIDPNWLNNTGAADVNWGATIVIGGSSTDWYGSGVAGVSYKPSFGNDYFNTGFVFENNISSFPKYVSQAISHESGHTLGLSHDGTTTSTANYGGTDLWAPIMGSGRYSEISQWSQGEYPDANNLEDDLAIITTRSQNGFSYRVDDHSNDINNLDLATPMRFDFSSPTLGTEILGSQGIIETRTDIDVFTFQVDFAHDNTFDLKVSANSIYPNLNIQASLVHFDTNGTAISTQVSNPLNNLSASFDNLATGNYLLYVDGVGEGDPLDPTNPGYSDYGSLGNYNIFGVA